MEPIKRDVESYKIKMNKRELSEYSGLSIAKIDRFIAARQIPHYKIGTGSRAPVRFDVDEINRWMRKWHKEAVA